MGRFMSPDWAAKPEAVWTLRLPRITALLKQDGWQVGKDRVELIWRREGLKVPQKQKPRGRLHTSRLLVSERTL